MALKDITGKRFGKLLVLSLAATNPYTKWLCKCDCGEKKVIGANALRNGDTISCGCHKKSKQRKIIGERFGRLIVLSLASIAPRKWLCECDCGNKTVVSGNSLCNGKTLSCGCYQKERTSESCFIDLSNETFGNLKVLSYEGDKRWKCRCSCGKELSVRGGDMVSGNTKSCGCYHKEQTRKSRLIDLTGKRFGKLRVLSEGEKRKCQIYWLCKCDCGTRKLIAGNSLSNGKSKSCGCRRGRFTHGKSGKSGYKHFLLSLDPSRKLRHYIGSTINENLKKRGYSKGGRTFDYLSYTPSQLKKHLESLFEPWMNWDNYGGRIADPRKTWHLDHIVPHSKFPYKNLNDPLFKECWALSNLRPLDKVENLLKGVK